MRRTRTIVIVMSLIAALQACLLPADELFDTQIKPLLERKCLSCHNEQDRKGSLSLQTAAAMHTGGESGAVVVNGDAAASYLLDLITPTDGKAAMPKGGQPLSPEEIAAVRKWIDSGAAWPDALKLEPEIWWSLRPLQRPQVPQTGFVVDHDGNDWPVRNPVDSFIAAKLEQNQLAPSPLADRRTLIRRLYFDLIGLPPTPSEIEAFVADPDPLAYEQLVDRLLAMPQYGERWARHWLDIVKYADTCGYDKDKLRPNAWPYRDYVIRSLNEDKPYARFVQEQVAGDALFPGSPDGILGLGFLAAGPWDFIGHVEVPESKIDGKIARSLDRDEVVSNVLNTFCSATVQCARCHNHKFDPFTQQHYYSLQAVFAAVDRAERAYDLDPAIEQQRRDVEEQLRERRQQLAKLNATIESAGGERLKELQAKVERLKSKVTAPLKRPEYGYHSQISASRDAEKWVEIDLGRPVAISRIVLRPCHDDYGDVGAGFGFPVRFRITARLEPEADQKPDQSLLVVDRTAADVSNPGLLPVEFPVAALEARYLRVSVTRLAERKNDFIFALAELEVFDQEGRNVAAQAAVTALDSIEAPIRWGRNNLTDGIFALPAEDAVAKDYAAALAERDQLTQQTRPPELLRQQTDAAKAVKGLEQSLSALPQGKLIYAAATHFKPQGSFQPTKGFPRSVHVLHRGNVTDPREEVSAGTLPVVPGVTATFELPVGHNEGDRRAALARWLVRDDNPLTWRTIVNRLWQFHFGEGLCATPNDFGRMGQLPTHPELLDWLAIEFRDNGQSFKQLHRLLVTSSAYRQTSADHAASSSIDGSNQSLWRMTRRRIEAEEVRDAILSVSGCLNLQMGGPGYYLFAVEKPEHSPHYEYDKFDPNDPATHRRSIYRFIVRSQPDPLLTTLDCADSSQSTPRRSETVTALQALALLNNKFNLTMATRFAERLSAEKQSQREQIAYGFQLVTGRDAEPGELDELAAYAAEHGLPSLCRLLFNLNEFVYID
ncbi:DUF1553 domain-containing protein [Planctomicrobium piriforme]|uniref:Planctomycete cytochrome C n=1 Tax=Planctomicrobium piriforme TaxID=1576369 RepID=A0A1I3P4Y5_9PLAN|nr:DUF1553 domain-containing protein [Planctomicrobium piriforme]SFJ16096.1 Planctomycete cytochrome C [Planctomicrobium piriforme]